MRPSLGLAALAPAAFVMAIALSAQARPAWDNSIAGNDRPTMEALRAGAEACDDTACTLKSGEIERMAWWVSRGNRLAIRLSFTAAPALDADGAHTLAQSYGTIIKRDPAVFLAMARDADASVTEVSLDAASTSDHMAGDKAAQVHELEARRDALSRVTDPALAELRDACLDGIGARLTTLSPKIADAR